MNALKGFLLAISLFIAGFPFGANAQFDTALSVGDVERLRAYGCIDGYVTTPANIRRLFRAVECGKPDGSIIVIRLHDNGSVTALQ